MEYIQCPHCLHKYGVNERMREAVGKKIQCKKCQQPFIIVITGRVEHSLDTSAADKPEQDEQPEKQQGIQAEQPNSEQPTASEDQPSSVVIDDTETERLPPVQLKRRLNTQFIALILLLITLFGLAVGLIIYFQFPQWLDSKQQPDTVTSAALINPIDTSPGVLVNPINLFSGPPEPDSNVKQQKEQPPVDDSAGRDKPMLEGPDQPSQVCRDAAADFWIRIHVMSSAEIDTRTYMQLLDQGLDQPAEIRNLCHDRFLPTRLTESAMQDKTPDWISAEVEARTKTR